MFLPINSSSGLTCSNALRSAYHDRKRGVPGTDLATGNRGIQVVAALAVDALGEVLGGDRADRAHVHHDLAGPQPVGNTVAAKQCRFHVGCVGNHGDDDVASLRHVAARGAADGTAIDQFLRQSAEIEEAELIAALQEMAGERAAHDAEADETDFHVLLSPC
jgi:hypothetical protein